MSESESIQTISEAVSTIPKGGLSLEIEIIHEIAQIEKEEQIDNILLLIDKYVKLENHSLRYIYNAIAYITRYKEKYYKLLGQLFIRMSKTYSKTISVDEVHDHSELLSKYLYTEGLYPGVEYIYDIIDNETVEDVYYHRTKFPIVKAIIDDDFDQLQEMSLAPGFTFINDIVVDPLRNRVIYSPAEFMARCGSVKCFKFALLNNPDILEKEDGFHMVKIPARIAQAAVTGGNMEIIHLLQQRGIHFDTCVEYAVRALQNDVLDWILRNHPPAELPQMLYHSIESFNIPAFLFFLLGKKQDINYNEKYPSKFTALHCAYCKSSNFLIQYCLDHGSNPELLNSFLRKPEFYKKKPL